VVLATNQSGVGRGLFDMATLNAIHRKMYDAVFHAGGRIDAIFFCPHAADVNCGCRKPKTGMYVEISQRYNMALRNVWAIGDSLRDLQAAESAGAHPVLVLTGKGEKTRAAGQLPRHTQVFADLKEAAKHLIDNAG
jgi:D-glycero-D-manno-heptose 1,7-bisphosphate phosphatase